MKWECVIALYGNTFISEQLIPEDIVGDDVEHNPNQHQRNSRGGGGGGGIKKAFVCVNRKSSKSKQSNIMKNAKNKDETLEFQQNHNDKPMGMLK